MRRLRWLRRHRSLPRSVIACVAVAVVPWATAIALVSPEESCQAGRAKAAGKYAQCIQNEAAKYFATQGNVDPVDPIKLGKCVTKYGATWGRLHGRALASPLLETCDAARFIDNADGTVTDNMTILQWEKKTDDATIHDKDDTYTWSSIGGFNAAADGGAFTTFLSGLNAAGFASQYDWRLPTLAEFLSITAPAYPDCISPPCIDPIFGFTQSHFYWSSSLFGAETAWLVRFDIGSVLIGYPKTSSFYVRAVRGGL